MDNNFYVNSVFNFIMRHCQAIFSSNLYETQKICISDSLTDGICSNNLFEQMIR